MKKHVLPQTVCLLLVCTTLFAKSQDWRSGIPWEKPTVVKPGESPSQPPADAVILFDGSNLDAWKKPKWTLGDDGSMTVKPGSGTLETKEKFGSIQMHLEFATPEKVEGRDQGRGNSGVFFMDGKYELQILDSFDNETYFDGQCGAMYKQRPPFVNACKGPGEWQSYDIIFTRPLFETDENGKLAKVLRPAAITVLQNGVVIQNHYELEGNTSYNVPPAYEAHPDTGIIMLQDHGNLTRFRNIWVRSVPDANFKPERTQEPYYK